MGEQPEEIEMGEPSLLQHVSQATSLNRTQASSASSHTSSVKQCSAPLPNHLPHC